MTRRAGINLLIDAYVQYSASGARCATPNPRSPAHSPLAAVAANTFLRSIFAAALPLVAMPLFHNLGVNFACTLLGCIAAALGFVPFALYRPFLLRFPRNYSPYPLTRLHPQAMVPSSAACLPSPRQAETSLPHPSFFLVVVSPLSQ